MGGSVFVVGEGGRGTVGVGSRLFVGQLEALGGTNRAGRGMNWAVIGMCKTGINGALAFVIRRRVVGIAR